MITLYVGSDHAGFPLKQTLIPVAKTIGCTVVDLGTDSTESVDYPDYAEKVARAVVAAAVVESDTDRVGDTGSVATSQYRGLMICGSGVGACIAANKIKGVRAGICHDTYSAHQGVEHDDMNVLVLGGRIIGQTLAEEILRAFLGATFTAEPRHLRRLNKVKALES